MAMHALINSKSVNRKQRGLTLVELLVALALGVVLVGGITRVYLENKRNYVKDEEMSRLQENGRFVLGILKHEIKMAGMFASTELQPAAEAITAITNDCETGWALNPALPIDFFDAPTNLNSSASGASFAGCINPASALQADSDVLSIKRTAGTPVIDNAVYTTGITSSDAKLENFYIRRTGRNLLSFEYVPATGFAGDVLTAVTEPTAQISMWLYKAKVFYVRNYSVVAGDNIPTLMMLSLEDKTLVETALIEGVEVFHIEWGIPSASSGTRPVEYISNPTSDEISVATVARIYLLMRTRNPSRDYTDTKTYVLGSLPPITTGDHFSRRVFTTTIKIRN